MSVHQRLIAATVAAFVPAVAYSTDCSPQSPAWPGQQSASFITLVSPTDYSWITEGLNKWNTACTVDEIPYLQTHDEVVGGTFNVNVAYHEGQNPNQGDEGACGVTAMFVSGGTIQSAEINIYDRNSEAEPCGDQNSLMAHEIGHLFGLTDTGELECDTSIMYNGSFSSAQRVSPMDCTKADSQWLTGWEDDDPCSTPNPPQGCVPGDASPILIDLDRDRIRLTGVENPVVFDINADGHPERLSWTSAGTLDGFLCLDRDGNGFVDSGRELFGNFTPLIDGSTAPNGYIPLAEFDLAAMGGNDNGNIDPGDAAYSFLDVWIDWNHNAVSDPGEILSLAQAGVSRISLEYHRIGRRDRHGNYFRYVSKAWLMVNGRERPTWTSDVFFIVE